MRLLENRHVTIVGGGLVGSLLSVFLARRGARVEVYEARDDPRRAGSSAGRSINLVVTSRGLRALERVGLSEEVLRLTIPVRGRMLHAVDARLAYQPYGRDESECNYSVSRAELNRFLISAAEERGVRFHFDRQLVEGDPLEGRWVFRDAGNGERIEVRATCTFGADGAASAVRKSLSATTGFDESVELLEHGYKELTIPADPQGAYRIEKHALHIWPRGDVMLMALPDLAGSFTVTLYLPHRGVGGFETLTTPESVSALFEHQFPDVIPLIPDLTRGFFDNPTGELGTVRCRPWYLEDRTALIGDAAHAIVPFFGQGMNCGFEDCAVLDDLIEAHGDDWGRVLTEYGQSRKPDADAIAEMALDNFVEMRDRVGDARFLLRKQIERLLEERMPRQYRSRYSMVMYSSIPYRVARDAGRIQERILGELLEGLTGLDDLDWSRARELIAGALTPHLERNAVTLDY